MTAVGSPSRTWIIYDLAFFLFDSLPLSPLPLLPSRIRLLLLLLAPTILADETTQSAQTAS
jgi:hypothetical protein